MKVKELIEELQKCNPDAHVEIEVGFDTRKIKMVDIGNPQSCVSKVYIDLE